MNPSSTKSDPKPQQSQSANYLPEANAPRFAFAWVLLATVLWLTFSAWIRPLALPDEGRYTQVAVEMLRSGDWLSMPLNGIPFFHKPPLFYWITGASVGLFGWHEWAVRLAPLIGSTMTAMALYLFCLRWLNARFAQYALLTLLVQPLFFGASQYANMDMLVAGCISVTTLLLAHTVFAIEAGEDHRQVLKTLLCAYVFAGLGFLSKGLIGIVLPAGVITFWLLFSGRIKLLLKLLNPIGIVLLAAMIAAWLLPMESRNPGFVHYFIVEQHINRFLATSFNNVQPWYFYTVALLGLSLPWLPAFFRSLLNGKAALKSQPIEPLLQHEKSSFLLMLVWLVLITLFFSKPSSKLIGYILPVMLPLAFLFTYGLFASSKPLAKAVRYWRISAGISLFVCAAMLVQFTIKPQHSNHEIGEKLLEQRKPDEPIYMLNYYFYDIPFYAKLSEPVGIVDNWHDPEIAKNDNWKKALSEGTQFAPAKAKEVLIEHADFAAHLCAAKVSWLVLDDDSQGLYPWLPKAQKIHSYEYTQLWRIDASQPELRQALACK